MPKVFSIDGVVPVVHPTAFVHPNAVIVGDVIIGPRCYVGPCASLRGDFGRLVLRDGANIQDNCTMHGFPGRESVIEENGHIGHGAVLHCCTIKRNAMVGMNTVVNDGAVIGESAIVAAMAFVKAGFEVPPRTLAAGVPAKVLRDLTEQEMEWKRFATGMYQRLTERCLASFQECEALTEVSADRKELDPGMIEPLHIVKGRNSSA
ncbi:MAG: phenylacetic acid degradation protein PaaY [Rhodospirillales bacterium]|nr:phenylacetic acid degradation protein PaaY [Rhodospirillales bacterium]